MPFSSATLLFCFLPLTLAGYHMIRRELRGVFLLLASLLFYAWGEPVALVVLLGVALLSYGVALGVKWVERKGCKPAAVALMTAAILLDLGILAYFKYTNFLIEIFNGLTGRGLALQEILLPAGISFFVFQSIAYMVDVYRGKIPA
ncbi:MAG: MBOAT family protein, partial [Aristaeellaceae bacterium]